MSYGATVTLKTTVNSDCHIPIHYYLEGARKLVGLNIAAMKT
jgi:hypothetical protein